MQSRALERGSVVWLVVLGALCSPALVAPHLKPVVATVSTIAVFAVSIVLAAAPFVVAGAVIAVLAQRLARHDGVVAAIVAAVAPGCDCSMNGFAPALRRATAALAGMALTWGASCNAVALIATFKLLGAHLLAARIVGGAVAALAVGALWRGLDVFVPALRCAPSATDCDAQHAPDLCAATHAHRNCVAHLDVALRTLAPAALASAVVLSIAPAALRVHASPLAAALIAALLSPCSTADPVLAKVIGGSAAAQAAFVIAAQCLDVRQLLLLHRHFGPARALLASLGAVAGCIAAVRIVS